jgi:hypothetical protein
VRGEFWHDDDYRMHRNAETSGGLSAVRLKTVVLKLSIGPAQKVCNCLWRVNGGGDYCMVRSRR